MPTYTLHYFDGRGFGEVSRQLFALSGTPYTDHRFSFEEWPTIKKTDFSPFGQIPILEVDGKKIPQSLAIARYLANQFGYAGKDAFEAAWVDAVGDQFKDWIADVQPFIHVLYDINPGDKLKLQKEIAEPARDKHFGLLEKLAKENGSGYLVGKSLTWVDLLIANQIEILSEFIPGFFDAFPTLLALKEKVQSEPKIKEWLEKRPKTRM